MTSNIPNLKDIQNKLYNSILDTGWDTQLRFFIKSGEFTSILEKLYSEVSDGKRFSPPVRDLFKMFNYTPYDEVKVVFLNREPYINPIYNTGLALSHTQKLRSDLRFIALTDELSKRVGDHRVISGDLSHWARQGVLLLNTSLTARVMLENRHEDLWKDFMYVIMEVLNRKTDLIWVSFGPNKYTEAITNENHIKITVPELPNQRKAVWDSGDMFNLINTRLVDKQLMKINW
jgi:uracil-DNA glycosylase